MTHPRRPRRLRTRLIVAVLALLAAICATVGVVSHLAMTAYLDRQIDGGLREAAARSFGPGGPAGQIDGGPGPGGGPGTLPSPAASTPTASAVANPATTGPATTGPATALPDPSDTRGQRPGTLNAVFNAAGATSSALVQTDGTALPLSAADLQLLSEVAAAPQASEVTLSSGSYRVQASTAATPAGDRLVTGLSTAERDATLASLDTITASVSLGGLAVLGLAGTLLVRRSLRPLDELSAVATTVASLPLESGDATIEVRIPPLAAEPGTEVGEVGIAFNNMLDHLTRAFAARHASDQQVRQFVADASHELRTPLTSIRGYTELLLLSRTLSDPDAAALRRVDAEAKRMSALVEDLLLLARLDEGQRGVPAVVDLTELLMDTVQDGQVSAPTHHWSLTVPDEPVLVRAVEAELRQILGNLLSNAHKHTAVGTRISVAVADDGTAAGAGGRVMLTVTNNGAVIAPAFLAQIFTRFARADTARASPDPRGSEGPSRSEVPGAAGSSGLGLAIVQALCEANGGAVSVTSTAAATVFTVLLPRA